MLVNYTNCLTWMVNQQINIGQGVQLILILFTLLLTGLSGILINWNNLLFTIFSIEVINISVIMIIVIISKVIYDLKGYIYGTFLLWLTASESAITLGLLVALFKFGGSIKFSTYIDLKG